MTPKLSITKSILLVTLFLAVFSVSGCMTAITKANTSREDLNDPGTVVQNNGESTETSEILAIEVGIEPTPFPEKRTYKNTEYGFQFEYPETWTISEVDHGVIVQKGARQLTIRFRWSTELAPPDFNRSGLPAGDLVYRGKISILEQVVPVDYLTFEDKIKMVCYNEGQAIESDDLLLKINLEDLNTEYGDIDLSETLIEEAKIILESLERVESEGAPAVPEEGGGICATDKGNPPQDWDRYKNEEYGFYFPYPSDMDIVDMDHLIMVRDGDLVMQIKYRRLDEQISMTGQIPEGDVELTRFVEYFGEENPNPIVVEKSNGQVNRVSVGNLITMTTPVQFRVSINHESGGGIDLDQANAMLKILDFLCIIP